MKKIFKKFRRTFGVFAMLIVLFVTSCDVTDIKPVSSFTDDNFWKTRVHAEGALFGVYDAFQDLPDEMLAYGESRGDLVQPGWGFCCAGQGFGQLQRNEITNTMGLTNWGGFYQVINRANVVIERAPRVVQTDSINFTQQDATYIVNEARFLRALAYFWLTRVWKDVPLVTQATTSTTDFMVKRTSQNSVLNFVQDEIIDILKTKGLRSQFPNNNQTKSRATQNAARALMAQVALWRNDYQSVDTLTTAIINSSVPKYTLVPGPNWYDNFSTGLTSEIIFELVFDASQNDRSLDYYNLSARVGMVPSTYLRDLHESPNNTAYRDEVRGNGRTWVWQNAYHNKWLSTSPSPIPADRVTTRVSQRAEPDPNFIFFRLADIYLMRAEARNRIGLAAEAIADINVVRTRANLPAATIVGTYDELTPAASQDQIEDAILQERAMELAGEAHRWFDLMRVTLRGRPDLLATYVNDASKYSFAGRWNAFADPTSRLRNPVSSDPATWYLPVNLQNSTTNPNLLETQVE